MQDFIFEVLRTDRADMFIKIYRFARKKTPKMKKFCDIYYARLVQKAFAGRQYTLGNF